MAEWAGDRDDARDPATLLAKGLVVALVVVVFVQFSGIGVPSLSPASPD